MGLFDKIKNTASELFSKKDTKTITDSSCRFCSKCGAALQEGACFCSKCGASIEFDNITENADTRTSKYTGEILKCPNCGETLNSFVTNCPTCGYELRRVSASDSVKTLAVKLEKIESCRHSSIGSAVSKVFNQVSSLDEQKIDLIRNFVIPNTKEDILEFVILAAANIDIKVYSSSQTKATQRELSDAWMSKLEQAYQKAQLMFPSSPEFQNIERIYNQKLKQVKKEKRKILFIIFGSILGFIAIIGFCLIMAMLEKQGVI
ncbi:MAG: zinc ribbon domain-containing protein [Candidatus Coproplasma sp.]